MAGDLLSPDQLATVARVRTVCTGAGIGGAVTSMAANMLASNGTVVGLAVGVIAPAAFILASEIASTASSLPATTGTRPLLATLVALLVVIGVSAAVVSFGHVREVVASVGESYTAEVLIAIVVDSVAVMGLVGHRLTGLYLHRHRGAVEANRTADQVAAERRAAAGATRSQHRAKPAASSSVGAGSKQARARTRAVVGDDPSLPAPERARVIAAANPEMTQAEIAELVGRGERTVRRYLAQEPTTPTAAADGTNRSNETIEPETNPPPSDPGADGETDGPAAGLVAV